MHHVSRVAYWTLAAALVGFGFLTGFSIGLPLLATGVALVALAPLRGRPAVFWSWLLGVVAFFVGYVLAAPLTCSAEVGATPSQADRAGAVAATGGEVSCTNLLGLDYAGGSGYDPPLWPATIAGLVTALGAGLATRSILVARSSHPSQPGT